MADEPISYRCTHGHRWVATSEALDAVGFTTALGYTLHLCRRCIADWIEQHIGQVREER